jgi:hypothetical protein
MQKTSPIENFPFPFMEEREDTNLKNIPKTILSEEKREYDFKESEVQDVEKLINSKLMCNIGYGGFSTVKLIYNHQQKTHYALKVVSRSINNFFLKN